MSPLLGAPSLDDVISQSELSTLTLDIQLYNKNFKGKWRHFVSQRMLFLNLKMQNHEQMLTFFH